MRVRPGLSADRQGGFALPLFLRGRHKHGIGACQAIRIDNDLHFRRKAAQVFDDMGGDAIDQSLRYFATDVIGGGHRGEDSFDDLMAAIKPLSFDVRIIQITRGPAGRARLK